MRQLRAAVRWSGVWSWSGLLSGIGLIVFWAGSSAVNAFELRILNAFPPPPGELAGPAVAKAVGASYLWVIESLAHLERVGFVESRWEEPPAQRPRTRLYRLTNAGLRERFERRQPEAGVTRTHPQSG